MFGRDLLKNDGGVKIVVNQSDKDLLRNESEKKGLMTMEKTLDQLKRLHKERIKRRTDVKPPVAQKLDSLTRPEAFTKE